MEAELVLGTFKYDEYFPNSERGQKLSQLNQLRAASQTNNAPGQERERFLSIHD